MKNTRGKSLQALSLCLLVLTPFLVVVVHMTQAQAGLSPTLKITLLVPTANSARRAWAAIIENNLDFLGIETSRVELPFSPNIFARALVPDVSVLGKTYDQGGFDLLFVGYNLGIDADPWSLYHGSQFAPTGQNYYLWNNTQNNQLSVQIKETVDKTARLNLVKQWQVLAADELPSIPILYTRETVAFDTTMSNAQAIFLAYHAPAWPPIEHLTTVIPDDSIILAQTGEAPGEGFIPSLSTSYYDLTVTGAMYSAMAVRNDTTFKTMIPQLASGTVASPGWSVAGDNKTWTVTLRSGVLWHDSATCTPAPACGLLTADDVKFTFDSIQNDTLASPIGAFVKGIIGGKDNVVVVNPTTLQFNLPVPYAYFVENILTYPIMPKHILGSIPLDQWKASKFNRPDTGTVGSNPIGTGPYAFDHWDSAALSVFLTRNDNYFDFPDKGRAALLAKGQFTVQTYVVKQIVNTDAAITALKNGEVNVLDAQFHLEIQPTFLAEWGAGKLATYDAFGVQEIGVNMKHPLLGTGVDTPLGRSNPSRAAEAAKALRQVISHAVPRDQIVSALLNGYGVPAITTPVVGNYKTGIAITEGFNTALTPYSFNMTTAHTLLRQAGYVPASEVSFWDVYGVYIAVALVAGVVVLAALYFIRMRKTRMPATPTASTSTSP